MLHIEQVRKRFGGLQALDGVSLEVQPGEFVGLIGPNGSGKTTLINCVSGIYRPDSGSVRLGERTISGLSPHRIFHAGIGRTFQITKVFRRLTVLQNLHIPALTLGNRTTKEIDSRARRVLADIKLEHVERLTAGSLSGGQQKLLEVGMVMMTDPNVILLDEPFGGVHPELKMQLEAYLTRINGDGKTILLVSHEMTSVFRMSRRLVVLDRGTLIADGPPESVRADERVIRAYLGGSHAA